jgi:putative PEP-CTERM system TPR-repeat lipoprotein
MTRMSSKSVRYAVAALLAGLITGCGHGDPSSLMASAKGYIDKGDYKSATIQIKSALQQRPDDAEARLLLARTLLATGDAVGAQTEARKALDLKYPPDKVYPVLARAMLGQGDFQKLVAEVGDRKLDTPAARADVGTSVATAYLALGDKKKARAAIDAVLAEAPTDARALTTAAQLDAADQDFAAASKHIDAALAAAPTDPDALSVKAALLLSQGKRDEALKALEKAAEANPNAVVPRFTLVSLLVTSGQVDRAATHLEALKKLAPRDLRTVYADALVYFAKGDAKHARESIQKVLGARPDHLPSMYLSGLIDLKLGSLAAAEEELRKVMAQAPQDLGARRALAAVYVQMGQPARAIQTLEPALARGLADPALLRVAGEAYLASGDPAKAGEYYEEANAIDKGNIPSEVRLAQVRFAAGDTAQALKDLETISKEEPSQYQADLTLITAHLRRGELDQALAAANALEKKQPENPLTYNIKGTIYAAKHDLKSARENLEKALRLQPNYFAAVRNLSLIDVQERKPEDARKRYEALLAKDPKNEQLLLAYAEVLTLTGQSPEAVKSAIDRAIAADPNSVPARMALINYSLRRGDAKGALAAAQAAQSALPNDAQVLEALGVAQLASGDANQAIAAFQRLAQLKPQQATILLKLADAQLRAKDYPGAIATLRKALALQPDLAQAWIGLAKVYVVSGHPDDALTEARKLQKEHPDRALGYAIEGEILASQKKWSQAATAYREGLAREPIPTLAVQRYAALENAKETTEATHMAERWFQEHPKDLTLHASIAAQSQLKKDYSTAAAHYRAALEIEPDNVVLLNNFAVLLSEQGDAKAASYAERAYQIAPYNPDVMDTYGWVLVQAKEATRGTELLRGATNLAPRNDQIRLHFAKALIQSGDKAGARRELEVIAQRDRSSDARDDALQLLKGL